MIWTAAIGCAFLGFVALGIAGVLGGLVVGFVGSSYLVKKLMDRTLDPARSLERARRRARRRFLGERRPRLLAD